MNENIEMNNQISPENEQENFSYDNELEEVNEEQDDIQINEYDLTSTPNDFNILTIYNFLESGAIIIPGFQRNYVWDIKRASKLIESIILGLPVPQVFLYEESRNKFLVIDGQQRLMTIYYFIQQRFPKKEKRTEIRRIFSEKGFLPEEIIHSDDYFMPFKLSLSKKSSGDKNIFHGLTYKTLSDYKTQFDLRPLRNIIVKQNYPKDDNSSVFEIFNRLNSGGMNLKPQEIRSSLYHSRFIDFIYKLNLNDRWRKMIKLENPDMRMRDIEVLFRGMSFLIEGDNYKPSLASFLNNFAIQVRGYDDEQIEYLDKLFDSFCDSISNLPETIFINPSSNRFNTFLFESFMYYIGRKNYEHRTFIEKKFDADKVNLLLSDPEYKSATTAGTTNSDNVKKRFERALEILDYE